MFNYEYSTAGVLLAILSFVGIILILIAAVKFVLISRSAELFPYEDKSNSDFKTLAERVKYKELNENQYRSIFFNTGLFFSISFSILILNWQLETSSLDQVNYNVEDILTPVNIPRIAQQDAPLPVPPPPLPSTAEILPVENVIDFPETLESAPILESIDYIEGTDMNLPPPLPVSNVKENDISKVHIMVDFMPRFLSDNCELLYNREEKEICAQQEMLQFIYKNVKYPMLARQENIEGRAVIQFVVEPDGTITDIKLVRELQGGLGEEAVRVVTLMAKEKKWSPGIQNGKPVRVRFTLPVQFSLR